MKVGDYLTTKFKCPICGSQERRFLSDIGRNMQKLDTVVCTGCGLVHSHPIPDKKKLDDFYRNAYRQTYKSSVSPKLKHAYRYAPGAYERVRGILKYAGSRQKKLLDVGCGSGEFLYMANKFGLLAEGIEPHQGYASYCKNVLKLNVRNTGLDKAGFRKKSFDIIHFNHVLEHMRDPLAELKILHGLLSDKGLLAVSVPNITARMNAPWTQFHFAHIYNFNPQTLNSLLQKAGFKILQADNTDVIAQKTTDSIKQKTDKLQDNYLYVWDTLNLHTGISHYKSATPYGRVLYKLWHYPREYLMAKYLGDPVKILDMWYNKCNAKFYDV